MAENDTASSSRPTAPSLDEAARARLRELKADYQHSKEISDTMRMSQCIYMAKSIKNGERTFIYDKSK
jgi:hypothetical protein